MEFLPRFISRCGRIGALFGLFIFSAGARADNSGLLCQQLLAPNWFQFEGQLANFRATPGGLLIFLRSGPGHPIRSIPLNTELGARIANHIPIADSRSNWTRPQLETHDGQLVIAEWSLSGNRVAGKMLEELGIRIGEGFSRIPEGKIAGRDVWFIPPPLIINQLVGLPNAARPIEMIPFHGKLIEGIANARFLARGKVPISMDASLYDHDVVSHFYGYLKISATRYWPHFRNVLQLLLADYDQTSNLNRHLRAERLLHELIESIDLLTADISDLYLYRWTGALVFKDFRRLISLKPESVLSKVKAATESMDLHLKEKYGGDSPVMLTAEDLALVAQVAMDIGEIQLNHLDR